MYNLSGRVGIVTGAGGGIGREIARRLTREGMVIAALDRDSAAAEAAAAEIGISVRKLYYRLQQYQRHGFMPPK